MKSSWKKLQDFYYHKGGKYIFFFGFYLIFFLLLLLMIKNSQNVKSTTEIKEEITSLQSLYQKDFTYQIDIEDNGETFHFTGDKNNLDYMNYDNKYFLDYVNINQLIKKSKIIENGNYTKNYELTNATLNELLKTTKSDGINRITEIRGSSLKDSKNTFQLILDLSSYLEKNYIVKLNYKVREK